jgi:hypothetical protein
MFNKYYYLVASLPRLEFDKRPPISREEFLSESEKWLDEAGYRMLASVDIKDRSPKSSGRGALEEWRAYDAALRDGLASVRKARKEGQREKTPAAFKEIFEEGTPLLMEKRLERMRWDFLDEEEFGRHFDLDSLVIYNLKLQILERLSSFDKEKGKEVFEGLCEVNYG